MNEREKRVLQNIFKDMGVRVVDLSDQGQQEPMTREQFQEGVGTVFPLLDQMVRQAQDIVNAEIGDYPVDEIALFFGDEAMANEAAVNMTIIDPVTVFNFAMDHVHTYPHESHYDVHYRFLQHASYPWRIEVMNITDGHSPLHAALLNHWGEEGKDGMPVHLSFKVPNEEVMEEVNMALDRNPNWIIGQACASGYGLFTYWKFSGSDDLDGSDLWIKPRLNRMEA